MTPQELKEEIARVRDELRREMKRLHKMISEHEADLQELQRAVGKLEKDTTLPKRLRRDPSAGRSC